MLKKFCLLIFIISINAIDRRQLTRFPDGRISYYAQFNNGAQIYGINFNIENPLRGTIGEIGGGSRAAIKNCEVSSCQNHKHLREDPQSPHCQYLLELYKIVKNDFEERKNNDDLPLIKDYK